jgi:rod shape determining protein RodA
MFDRRLLTHFDWVLVLMILLVATIGIVNLFSATSAWGGAGAPIYLKQCYWLAIGVIIAFTVCAFDYRHLGDFGFLLYGITLVLLLLVLIVGKTTMGATRWIHLGFFNLQPSELIKIVIILTLAPWRRESNWAIWYARGI